MSAIDQRPPLTATPPPGVQPHDEPFWQLSVVLPFLAVSLIWGSTWIVIRDQLAVVPPSWSVSYRFALAAAAMFVVAIWRRVPLKLSGQAQLWAVGIGLTQFALNFNFVYRSEAYITSGLVAVIFALLMVPNAILSRIFLGQRLRGAFLLGSMVAIAGVGLLFVHEFRAAPPSDTPALLMGAGFAVTALFCASAANVMQGARSMQQWPILAILAWAMLWGSVIDAIWALITVGGPSFETRIGYPMGIAYLGIIGSAVAFPLYFTLIRRIGAGRAAYSGVLVPVIAMAISTAVEGYRWSTLSVAGGVLSILGLIIAMQARKPRTPRAIG